MLKEINVKQSLIDVIGNFLRQKSQKTFIGFELFKDTDQRLKIKDIFAISLVLSFIPK